MTASGLGDCGEFGTLASMNEQLDDVLHVDGFEIRLRSAGEMVLIEVEKDGEKAMAGIKSPGGVMPPREQIEMMAMSAWKAQHNMMRKMNGLPRDDG